MTTNTPPKATESEERVIGAILNDPGIVATVRDTLTVSDFSSADYGQVYGAILELHDGGYSVDPVSIVQTMQRWSHQDSDHLAGIIHTALDYACQPHSVPYEASVIRETARRRRLIFELGEVLRNAYDPSVEIETVARMLSETVSDATAARAGRRPKLKTLIPGDPGREPLTMRRYVVHGLLRLCEVLNVVASPKVGKSWLALLIALSVAFGRTLLGRFQTTAGNVLIVDNELDEAQLEFRVQAVAHALGISPEEYFKRITIHPLRGEELKLDELCRELELYDPGTFNLVIVDAWYKAIPRGFDENSNSDVTTLYAMLDRLAAKMQAAIMVIHHSTKGDQSGKAVTDVGAGASAQARAADTHMVIRPHEADGAFVVEAAVRSSPPFPAFVIRRDHPLWVAADELDPADVKTSRPKKQSGPDREEARQQRDEANLAKVMQAYAVYPDGETQRALRAKCRLSGQKFNDINDRLIADGLVEEFTTKKGRQTVTMYKLTEAGQAGLNSDCPTCPTCPAER